MKNIKRYLIFAYDFYEAMGGMDDCIGKADTIKKAHKIINEYVEGFTTRDEFTIYDLLEEKDIYSSSEERKK